MVVPWRPLPCAVNEDLRLLSLDAPAQAVAFRLAARAVNGAVAVGRDVDAAVVAMCGGGAWARDGFEALESAGLVTAEGESVVLAWEWPTMRGEPPAAPPLTPRRTEAPSDGSTARARLRALFSKHGLKDAPGRLAWLASDKGRETVARLGLSETSARDLAGSARSNRCNPDLQPDVTGDVTGCNQGSNHDVTSLQPAPPSQTLPPKKEERNTDSEPREAQSNLEATKVATSKQPDVTGASNPPATPAKGKRAKAAPMADTPPLPGTLAHRVYLAIVNDPGLRPIVGNPGDAAQRWSDPAMFPGVDVLATVLAIADYVSRNPGKYTDGRAFMLKWLKSEAEKVALRPKPAPAVSAERAAPPSPNDVDPPLPPIVEVPRLSPEALRAVRPAFYKAKKALTDAS